MKNIFFLAPYYIDNLMTWINDLLANEAVFPTRDKAQFPAHFRDICVKIFRRLFRVYAHIYICHIEDIRRLEEEPHLNTSFKHFIFFVQEFQERFINLGFYNNLWFHVFLGEHTILNYFNIKFNIMINLKSLFQKMNSHRCRK